MAKSEVSTDVPAGSEYTEERETRPGKPAYDKAPPEACAIRPVTIKLVGMPPWTGEIQGTRSHVEQVAGKYRNFFHSLCEWIEVEGERV